MKLINQPFDVQLGNYLIELLDSKHYQTLNIVVAFAKNSGVLRIKESLKQFRARGGVVNVYLGIDLDGTSYEALSTLFLHTDSLNVIHAEKDQTFHSKVYQFLGQDKGVIIVGSHNLTAGGLWTNFESSVVVPVNKHSDDNVQILDDLDAYFDKLKSLQGSYMEINSQDDVDNLLDKGYISKEVDTKVSRSKTFTQNRIEEKLFGNGIKAKLPCVDSLKKELPQRKNGDPTKFISASLETEEPVIWFETRKLTGGSRNILDLSKKSLIEHGNPVGTLYELEDAGFMRGGVEFFGLNANVTHEVKNITLHFEGVDYKGNTILFPEGKRANGTWRLQIKGVSDANEKITEAFKAKDEAHYLVEKVITFTKIQDDYYVMSVFPESKLEDFKKASYILARNGSSRSAKYLGLL